MSFPVLKIFGRKIEVKTDAFFFPRSSRGQRKKDGLWTTVTGIFPLTCNSSYSELQIKKKQKNQAGVRQDGVLSPFVFVPIAADFQR